MQLILKTLFDNGFLTVRHAIARPPASGVEYGLADQLLLPVTGVFAKHDSRTHRFIANTNHALFFQRGEPYRISFPGNLGDESLVIRFSAETLANVLIDVAGIEEFASPRLNAHCLLAPAALLTRDLLWRHLVTGTATPLAVEEVCLSLLAASLRAASHRPGNSSMTDRGVAAKRRREQVETVKEVISLCPSQNWTLRDLAWRAHTTPYHLARIFHNQVGIPVHQYLLRVRLARALEDMRIPGTSLTNTAIEAGFSSASHFSATFRAFFGVTPSQFRTPSYVPGEAGLSAPLVRSIRARS